MKRFFQNKPLTIALSILIGCLWAPVGMADQSQAMNSQMADAAQIAKGARDWANQCQRCHNLRDPAEFTDDIWDCAVTHMRIRANIPAEQIRNIKAFLKSSN